MTKEKEQKFVYHHCGFCEGTGRKKRASGRDGICPICGGSGKRAELVEVEPQQNGGKCLFVLVGGLLFLSFLGVTTTVMFV